MSDETFDPERPVDPEGPVELGIFSVDELAAMVPGRIDLLGGDEPDAAAGARALMAGGRMRLATGSEDTLEGVPTDAAAVAAGFLSDPDRIVMVRVDDLFGTDEYVLYGRDLDGTPCFVLEGGTAGVRRLIFVLADDAPGLVSELTGLDELGESANAGEPPRDVDIEADVPADTPLGKALAQPTHSVTVSAGRAGHEPVDVSFVHGDDSAWLVEWDGAASARISPLDAAAVAASLAKLLT